MKKQPQPETRLSPKPSGVMDFGRDYQDIKNKLRNGPVSHYKFIHGIKIKIPTR